MFGTICCCSVCAHAGPFAPVSVYVVTLHCAVVACRRIAGREGEIQGHQRRARHDVCRTGWLLSTTITHTQHTGHSLFWSPWYSSTPRSNIEQPRSPRAGAPPPLFPITSTHHISWFHTPDRHRHGNCTDIAKPRMITCHNNVLVQRTCSFLRHVFRKCRAVVMLIWSSVDRHQHTQWCSLNLHS